MREEESRKINTEREELQKKKENTSSIGVMNIIMVSWLKWLMLRGALGILRIPN